ncbi:DNA-methyltransferase [Cohnella nanjingensis]|uniref:Methyltransferase n=1 Tax=Cohnella nanjingensis TaxID=1387779 RepID=A0A7X0RVA3_9BACL|nr:site-specific DNA-methyltransferase [Cohnella nanjingensis]MBB6673035.1 site-specific DNA-methyltransferase [Cohnella nanjingensis]
MLYNEDCVEGCKKYIANDSVDLIVTDPPYNLGFGGTKQTKSKQPRFSIIANDQLSHRDYQRFTFQWLHQAYRVLKPGRHIYVCIDWRMYPHMVLWMRRVGFIVKNCIVWDKERMGMGWQYRYRHEFIIFAVKDATRNRRVKTRTSTDVWRYPRIPGNKTVHPTEKPLDLMSKAIQESSEEGERVLDLFMGSGPAAVAALTLNREFTGFEVDLSHFDTASKRVSELSFNR